MPVRTVLVANLQPIDTLRTQVLSHLESLNTEEIEKIGLPQVWETPMGLIISDGHNRTALLAQRGCKKIRVEYNKTDELSEEYCFFFDIITRAAKQLQSRGIYSVYDLLQA